jgi:two-component system response regulator MprA
MIGLASKGKRILVVDDEPAVREVLSVLLRADGHTVELAKNGREACLRFAPGDFDLVITDYAMPEMNGDEMARAMKGLVPSQPILMLTAYAGEVCGAQNPVDGVLEKPFAVAALRQMIRMLLRLDIEASGVAAGRAGRAGTG